LLSQVRVDFVVLDETEKTRVQSNHYRACTRI
jgi:hypothetical protein